MDWDAAIERCHEALKRTLAALVAMAGLRGQFTFFPHEGAPHQGVAHAEKSKLSPAPTLPRHLHRAVARLLRPAEAAARRLVIVAARGLVVILPPRKPGPWKPESVSPAGRSGPVRTPSVPRPRQARRTLSVPLFDPPQYPFSRRRRTVSNHDIPRITALGGYGPPLPFVVHRPSDRTPVPPPPSPDDPIDATRLSLRLAALGRVLDDLPAQTRRFARWKARRDAAGAQNAEHRDAAGAQIGHRDAAGAQNAEHRDAAGAQKAEHRDQSPGTGRIRRLSPLRPGYPYGVRRPGSRRRPHEVDEILRDIHHFALLALKKPDTS